MYFYCKARSSEAFTLKLSSSIYFQKNVTVLQEEKIIHWTNKTIFLRKYISPTLKLYCVFCFISHIILSTFSAYFFLFEDICIRHTCKIVCIYISLHMFFVHCVIQCAISFIIKILQKPKEKITVPLSPYYQSKYLLSKK